MHHHTSWTRIYPCVIRTLRPVGIFSLSGNSSFVHFGRDDLIRDYRLLHDGECQLGL